jgi:hypothetical protein
LEGGKCCLLLFKRIQYKSANPVDQEGNFTCSFRKLLVISKAFGVKQQKTLQFKIILKEVLQNYE